MKLYGFGLFLLLLVFGCKFDNNQVNDNYAYLGGEIINPNDNVVILSQAGQVIDTITLDYRNRFLHKIENLNAGLYTFLHGGEIQMVFLEPKDSLLFRLNTLEFDESLVFTGIGDNKNNYLIREFLENETQEKKIFKYCQLDPDQYENEIDSIKSLKIKRFNNFKNRYEVSALFEDLALANINYNYYSSKEVYPFVHYGYNKAEILNSLPKDFYNYRKEVNYNDTLLKDYHYYNSFLRYSLNNLALQEHIDHHEDTVFNRRSLCFNIDLMKLTDSLVSNVNIKNELLHHFALNYLSKSPNTEANSAILNTYLILSSNEKGKEMMKNFTSSLNALEVGAPFPDLEVVNYNNETIALNSLFNKPTVICFWSDVFFEHFKKSHYLLKDLKSKYPEVNFLSINIDNYGIDKAKKSLRANGFPTTDEYQFRRPTKAYETLAIRPMTKAFIVDKNNKIANNHTNIFSSNFEQQLLGVLNR
ncbi:TlpA family protein disulfide reductase [Gaetbulibacter saemankumensis]|uniref:TlpA family protein disulfide reductase n=1 Tax=Gaetbulibacter saemankumensis TaxID=311208 RepID=UPI0003F896E4|nr:redoxin domain-containing protein [Gaetbulibacter saemankumensis]